MPVRITLPEVHVEKLLRLTEAEIAATKNYVVTAVENGETERSIVLVGEVRMMQEIATRLRTFLKRD